MKCGVAVVIGVNRYLKLRSSLIRNFYGVLRTTLHKFYDFDNLHWMISNNTVIILTLNTHERIYYKQTVRFWKSNSSCVRLVQRIDRHVTEDVIRQMLFFMSTKRAIDDDVEDHTIRFVLLYIYSVSYTFGLFVIANK